MIERSGDGGADSQTDTDRHEQENGKRARDIPRWRRMTTTTRLRDCGRLTGKLCVSTVAAVLADQVVSVVCQLFWARAAAFLARNWWRAPVWHASREIGIARRAGMGSVAAVHAGQHSRTNSRGRASKGSMSESTTPRHTPRVSPSIETYAVTSRGHRQDLIRGRVLRSRYRS
jgi:hypothetical protein